MVDPGTRKMGIRSSDSGHSIACLNRPKIREKYEFVYKQAVTPNDVYLQMSDKTPSTIFCEELVMKIKLPDTESSSEIKLDVKPTYLKLTSPRYYLATYLPHKVNDTRSSATWDALSATLVLTMPMVDRNMLAD
ncbi:protein PIH1D3-like [Selaginella moellendorffii]|uniref:protein PIH1D3-like n=1 Tax=Selaginella moellendorffii TaxID=88036 RepID=UPI000D1CABDD|nr:protein PIH1D3-like [Selaginella moellendorffii]|eukprot:XP_024537796.1 protein PIH1D3-like [Selaginella moellendorffii]